MDAALDSGNVGPEPEHASKGLIHMTRVSAPNPANETRSCVRHGVVDYHDREAVFRSCAASHRLE